MKHSITSHCCDISLTEDDLKWLPQNSNNSVVQGRSQNFRVEEAESFVRMRKNASRNA